MNYELLMVTEDIPEAGLLKGEKVWVRVGFRPQVIRDWNGNPGLLLNLACEDRLQFCPIEEPAPESSLKLLR